MARDIFTEIYQHNLWGDAESRSGNGSTLVATEMIRKALPDLFLRYGIKSVLDIPCGDRNWAVRMRWPEKYIGADVVEELIDELNRKYPGNDFRVLDIVRDKLPKVDLVFVRDLFGHLPHREVAIALENIKRSGSRYLLTTTWPRVTGDEPDDFVKGYWRKVNMEHHYGMPKPLEYVIDGFALEYGGTFEEKQLGLWEINK